MFHLARTAAAGLSVLAALGACSAVNPYYDASRPHHRPAGFQNHDAEFETKGLAEVLRWRWRAWREDLPPPPQAPVPAVAADLEFLRMNGAAGTAMQPAVTWIGHATALVQLSGLNLLTDPIFSERASPLSFLGPQRVQPPGVALAELPRIHLVVVSHNHYDHLDEASVRTLAAQPGGPPVFVVPLGLKPWFASIGIAGPFVVELDWWQSHHVGSVEVMLTPAQHWSGRGLADRLQTLWGGFAVLAPDCHLYYAGDTGYSRDFTRVRERLAERQREGGGFDLALLPIGAYEPRWFMTTQHVNPAEAVQIHRDLGAKRSLGVHWGTFRLTDESLDEPPRALAQARRDQAVDDNDFFVLAVGQTRVLPRR